MNGNKIKKSVLIISITFILSITFLMFFNINSDHKANMLKMTNCFDKKVGISVEIERKFLTSNTTVSCEEN